MPNLPLQLLYLVIRNVWLYWKALFPFLVSTFLFVSEELSIVIHSIVICQSTFLFHFSYYGNKKTYHLSSYIFPYFLSQILARVCMMYYMRRFVWCVICIPQHMEQLHLGPYLREKTYLSTPICLPGSCDY